MEKFEVTNTDRIAHLKKIFDGNAEEILRYEILSRFLDGLFASASLDPKINMVALSQQHAQDIAKARAKIDSIKKQQFIIVEMVKELEAIK